MRRPAPTEYAPYYRAYVDLVPEEDVLPLYERELEDMRRFLAAVPPERETHRYREDRWSVREVVGHILDVERLFGYRAFVFSRDDPAEHPSFEQDLMTPNSNAHERPLAELVEEFAWTRRSHLALFRGLSEEMTTRVGRAAGVRFSVRCLAWILVGHERHHKAVLRERYGL